MKQLSTLKRFLLCASILCLSGQVFAQSNEGTNFWFGFMEHRDINSNSKVAMITSKVNTSGTISMPNLNWSESFNVAANNVTIINFETEDVKPNKK